MFQWEIIHLFFLSTGLRTIMNDMVNTHRKIAPFDIFCLSDFYSSASMEEKLLSIENCKHWLRIWNWIRMISCTIAKSKSFHILYRANQISFVQTWTDSVAWWSSFIIEQYIIFNTDVISFCLIYPHQRVSPRHNWAGKLNHDIRTTSMSLVPLHEMRVQVAFFEIIYRLFSTTNSYRKMTKCAYAHNKWDSVLFATESDQ